MPLLDPSLAEFEQLYTQQFAFVWRVLRRFGVECEQLEDAVQDVFVVWVRRRAEFGRQTSPRTCLYGIARRVAADSRRAAARALRRHKALSAVVSDRDDSFEQGIEAQHAMATLDRALQQLSEVQREAYWLAEVEGLSAQQIGAALRISPNTASSRLRLARLRLAAALGEGRPSPVAEEPPAETRQRVWAVLVPVWERCLVAAPTSAVVGSALRLAGRVSPHVLVGMLYATIIGLALLPPASTLPAPTPRAPPVVVAAARPFAPVLYDMPEVTATPAAPPVTLAAARRQSRPTSPRARPAPADPLAREARQIAAAQRLLYDQRADEALAVLDTHAKESPHGRLADEREALRCAARCRRGERDAGLAAANRWFAGRPDAPALATARAFCRTQELSAHE